VALPLTYLPILLVANDRTYMGSHGNGRLANALGCFYLVVIILIALSAIPLLLLTNGGQG
jgi:Mn2+/Fe2+ NRAMP family transporter